MSDIYAVVLAAGKGTRMKSKLYKVLHPVCGKPMVQHVVDIVQKVNPKETILIVGHGAEMVREQLGSGVSYVLQEEQLGTGHAVKVAKDRLENKEGTTIVLCGDTPLVTETTLRALIDSHQQSKAAVSVLTTQLDDPTGYGRIIRNERGEVIRNVEQKDTTIEEQQVREVNTGIYCFDNQSLMDALEQISNQNAQGEYYLTDCLQILYEQGHTVNAFQTTNAEEIMGVNDRVALAEAEQVMRMRINRLHMRQGVTIIDPNHTYIGVDVAIGQDNVIHPGTVITGSTVIGEECTIGPQTELHNMNIGDRCTIQKSVLVDSHVGTDTTVGPFAYVRPGSRIGSSCKVGDFVEVKNSVIGDGTKIPHLSYIGDADLGENVNMGCGSITVNYDGEKKHRTVVEDGSFVGCNVNLIAPVKVGRDSYIAAGSTINKSISAESFAIARERQVTKENYVEKLKKKNKKS
jgi:bifunctional UDP-N-acetylglucosamine pyrophosphorylase/glucosamine-1-phosphate N-acetyltransferase